MAKPNDPFQSIEFAPPLTPAATVLEKPKADVSQVGVVSSSNAILESVKSFLQLVLAARIIAVGLATWAIAFVGIAAKTRVRHFVWRLDASPAGYASVIQTRESQSAERLA